MCLNMFESNTISLNCIRIVYTCNTSLLRIDGKLGLSAPDGGAQVT